MFFFFFGMLCGIVLGQEISTIPKVKPYIETVWNKLNNTSVESSQDDSPSETSKND